MTNESFCFFFQKEARCFLLRAAGPPTPRACSFLKTGCPAQRTKKRPFLSGDV
jgi:hypothetical protein